MSHAEVVQIRNPMKVPVLVFNKPLVERGLDANSEASAAALRTAQEHRHGQSQGCVPFCIHVVACKPLQRCWCTGGGGCAPRNSHFLFISFYDARGNRGVSSQTREKIGELIHFIFPNENLHQSDPLLPTFILRGILGSASPKP